MGYNYHSTFILSVSIKGGRWQIVVSDSAPPQHTGHSAHCAATAVIRQLALRDLCTVVSTARRRVLKAWRYYLTAPVGYSAAL